MRGFRASQFSSTNQDKSLLGRVQTVREGLRMFHWFQSLLPKQGGFFEQFEAHAQTLVAGSGALARLLQGDGAMNQHIREIVEREEEADAITRQVLQSVRRTFLTPFDRGAITSLISAMDDAIDEMQKTAGAVSLYEVSEFEQEMRDIAAIIIDSTRLLTEADDIHAKGLKKAFVAYGSTDTLRFIVTREIYSHLEKVVDRLEDVANEIDGLVIDHA